jgi:drug/metabolite transporter (DMT)-like permease
MIYLLLTVVCTTGLYLLFKLFERWNVQIFEAIFINYLVAFGVGVATVPDFPKAVVHIQELPTWLIGGLSLGFFFITVFNVTGRSAQIIGLSNTTISAKMSLVMVVVLMSIIAHESLNLRQWFAVVLAVVAVVLASWKGNQTSISKNAWVYPLVIFTGSTLIDFLIPYLSKSCVNEDEQHLYSTLPFFAAGICGVLYMIYCAVRKVNKFSFGIKEILGGVVLGIINLGSIYFLVLSIHQSGLSMGHVVCVNNLGVVVFSSVLAVLVFKEKLNSLNVIGIILALLALGLLW